MWSDCSDTGESKEDSIERRRLMKTTSQLSSDKSIPGVCTQSISCIVWIPNQLIKIVDKMKLNW